MNTDFLTKRIQLVEKVKERFLADPKVPDLIKERRSARLDQRLRRLNVLLEDAQQAEQRRQEQQEQQD